MALIGPRCPICGNDTWHDRDWPECTHCGLAVCSLSAATVAIRDAIDRRLSAGLVDLSGQPPVDWTLDMAALRNAAWRLGFTTTPLDAAAAQALADPPGGGPTRATARRAITRSHDVILGIIARAAESDAVAAMLDAFGGQFRRVIVALDGDDGGALARRHPATVIRHHPLAGDFAAQRNRVQQLAGDGWVLQLDTDEQPEAPLLAALGWLTAAADRDGVISLGLPRRNLVDGRQSALWPDIQYRLNRAEVRFAGTVHERPQVPFARTSLALVGAIAHRLSGDRVRERSRVYEAMSLGAGRPEDEAALLRPFDDAAR